MSIFQLIGISKEGQKRINDLGWSDLEGLMTLNKEEILSFLNTDDAQILEKKWIIFINKLDKMLKKKKISKIEKNKQVITKNDFVLSRRDNRADKQNRENIVNKENKLNVNRDEKENFWNKVNNDRNEEKNKWYLKFGIQSIDILFHNRGLESGKIYFFYGKGRSGKTQIMFHLALRIYQKFQKSRNKILIYFIDTENTFRPERIHSFFKNIIFCELNKNFSDRINVIKANTMMNLVLLKRKLKEMIMKDKPKAIIIDSLTQSFRVELANKELSTQKIMKELSNLMDMLQNLAIEYNILILTTGQVTNSFHPLYFFNVIPVFKNIINLYSKEWILLSENEDLSEINEFRTLRFLRIVNSTNYPEGIARFYITPNGLT